MDGRHLRIEALFQAARRLPAQERTSYLEAECSGDPALRAEVSELLEAFEEVSDDPEADRLAPFLEGSPYRVLRRIGSGGMSVVYEAQPRAGGPPVALKVLLPGATSDEGRRRFAREAEILGRLRHPGIARLHGHGVLSGPAGPSQFIAMELLEGPRFHEALTGLGPREGLRLLARVADAVAYAHRNGVIHRDLKPANILFDAKGEPKVVDFGIARLVDGESLQRTRTGQVLGTLAYMSPEQALGDLDAIDERTDVYSLGVIAYEAVCGRLPHETANEPVPAFIRRIVEEDPPDPGWLDATLRGDVSRILRTALAKDPAGRYPSATAFADDLRRHLAGEPIAARAPTLSYHLRRFLRRHKALAAGLATAVAALVGGLGLALHSAARERGERLRADESAQAARWAAAQAAMEAASTSLRVGAASTARQRLEEVPVAYRGWPWRYLAARTDGSYAQVPVGLGPKARSWFSPDGGRLLALEGSKGVIVGVRDGRREALALPEGRWRLAGFVGSAPVLLGVGAGGCALAWPETGNVRRIAAVPPVTVQALATAPDGVHVALAYGRGNARGEIRVADARTGQVLLSRHGDGLETYALAFSRDGRLLAASGWGFDVAILDLATGEEVRRVGGHTGAVRVLAFSPDDRLLASGSDDKSVRIWRVADGALVRRTAGYGGEVTSLAWSRAGDRVAAASRDGAVIVWDADPAGGERALYGGTSGACALAWTPDDRTLLAAHDDAIRSYDVTRGRDPDVLRLHRPASAEDPYQAYVYAVAFDASGSVLASGGWDSTVRLVDPRTGTLLATLEQGSAGRVFDVCFGPGPGRLVSAWDRLTLWDTDRRQVLAQYQEGPRPVAVTCAPDGRRIACLTESTLLMLDPTTLERREGWSQPGHRGRGLAWSPDGSLLATVGLDGTLRIRAFPGGEELQRLTAHPGGALAVAFDPGSRRVATGGEDRVVRVWDATSGRRLEEFRGHRDRVYCLAFHPEGDLLASGANDNTIRLWDLRRGVQCAVLRGHENYVYDLAWSPDGTTLASASGDGSVRIWTTRTARERRVGAGR